VSGQIHTPIALHPGKNPNTFWTGRCLDPRAILEVIEDRNIS